MTRAHPVRVRILLKMTILASTTPETWARCTLPLLAGLLAIAAPLLGQAPPRLAVEAEAGPVWQTRNDVQVPNDAMGTRFSLVDVAGRGPWTAGRLYTTWSLNDRHALRLLLAPLTVSGTGTVGAPLEFAGETFTSGSPLRGTYQFNSYRLTYRYLFHERERLQLRVGFSAKVRDARIQLDQGATSARNTDVGFVPLLHFAADWKLAQRTFALLDFDGLAGGPGRAFDVALKLGRDLNDRWRLNAGYRTVEGGADVETVYAFAWLHYAVASVTFRY
jgi:hypothetical protein